MGFLGEKINKNDAIIVGVIGNITSDEEQCGNTKYPHDLIAHRSTISSVSLK